MLLLLTWSSVSGDFNQFSFICYKFMANRIVSYSVIPKIVLTFSFKYKRTILTTKQYQFILSVKMSFSVFDKCDMFQTTPFWSRKQNFDVPSASTKPGKKRQPQHTFFYSSTKQILLCATVHFYSRIFSVFVSDNFPNKHSNSK